MVPESAKRPRNGTLAQSPYEQLRNDIFAGEFAPGFPLVEGTLAESFGVSRTPIREALTRLEQDGLVVRTDRGLIVRERSPEEILDIYDVRILIAGLGARLAARRRTVVDLIRIRTQFEIFEEAERTVASSVQSANRGFLRAVWRASGSTPVQETMDRLSHQIGGHYPSTTLLEEGRFETTLREHRALLVAIEVQDEDAAAEASMTHFQGSREMRLKMFSAAARDGDDLPG